MEREESRSSSSSSSSSINPPPATTTAPNPTKRTRTMTDDEKREAVRKVVVTWNVPTSMQDKWIDNLLYMVRIVQKSNPPDKQRAMHSIVLGAVNDFFTTIQENIPKGLLGDLALCSNAILEALDLAVGHEKTEQLSYVVGNNDIANKAFGAEFTPYGGEKAFLDHLAAQKLAYANGPSMYHPFFSVIQSSGYGKSRLMKHLQEQSPPNVIVLYLSFAAGGAVPARNVAIEDLAYGTRKIAEKAFVQLFEEALKTRDLNRFTLKAMPSNGTPTKKSAKETKEVLFVLDEVAQLLSIRTKYDDVDYFRCLFAATTTHKEYHPASFFVLLSTFASVTRRMIPGSAMDPSSKRVGGFRRQFHASLAPFLLHHAIALRNDAETILQASVTECHTPQFLLGMGRPMWHAFLSAPGSEPHVLVDFAMQKLLLSKMPPAPSDLSQEQMLALLSCRVCLTISPVSRFAPAMVASHMATAVIVSTRGDEVVVSYPSEPILALASRRYTRSAPHRDTFPREAFHRLKQYFISGAVAKGHRGEVIVRFLNLMAMDKCMADAATPSYCVQEVQLKVFLAQFDRDNASLSEHLKAQESTTSVVLNPRQTEMLEGLGLLPTSTEAEVAGERFPFELLEKGTVCFTHFIHLESDAEITPDLLRLAYRRTAALVVNAGRRGIDWIIPVKVGDDAFVGLAGQDKNRMRDTLDALTDLSEEASHHKVTTDYFLTRAEMQLFVDRGWPLQWPAILFAVGTDELGAGLAEQTTRRLRRKKGRVFKVTFPCMVLTGLGYTNFMDTEADKALRALREITIPAPLDYTLSVPLTYGVPDVDPKPSAEAMEM
jgi:hypothetical protein